MRALLFLLTMLFFAGIIVVTGDCLKYGALPGILTGLVLVIFQPKRYCPKCAKRKPPLPDLKSFADWWYLRWYCPYCGAHVSKEGKLLP